MKFTRWRQFLALATLALSGSCALAQGGNEYLNLAKGKKWVLRSPASQEPVILEVLSKKGQEHQLRFDNPWAKSEMTLVSRGGRFYVTAVTFGGNSVSMPADTLYFDLTAAEGKTWRNAIGTLSVVSRKKTVQAGGKTYRDCIHIREVTKEGNQLHWIFARGVGFVQFGDGNGAFVLDPAASSVGGNDDSGEQGQESEPDSDSTSYLPLSVGKQWDLRSPSSPTPVMFQVLEKQGRVFELAFNNPWANSRMSLREDGGKYYVTAVEMGGGTASLPANTLYFDFTAREGTTWKNQIGTMTVVSRNKTVRAGETTYRNCIQIREVTKEGNQLYWTFAPGVGFVQFGEGKGAFVLASAGNVSSEATGAVSSADRDTDGRVLIALAANTFANEPFNTKTIEARFRQSLEAGISYVYLSPKWQELEPDRGRYNWKDIEFQIRQAEQSNLPVICNVRVVDTGNRAMPRDLMGLSFRDQKVRTRLLALLDGLLPRLKGRAQFMLIGNEVDAYFRGRTREVADYAGLFEAAKRRIKELKPGTPVSVSVTFEGIRELNTLLKPFYDRSDYMALTYYPLNPDFTFRDPGVVSGDFRRIVSAARGKKILFQEIGYSTDALNDSSQDKQARFYANVFRGLREHADSILGANFLFMSDLPDSLVDSLAQYYQLPNAERFKAFLRTLGMFDQRGRPKKGWQVFREETQRMKNST